MFETNEELPLNFLYSKGIEIKLEILNALYRNYYGYTIEELSNKLHISKKTLYKYLKHLRDLSLQTFNNDLFLIDEQTNKYRFKETKIKFLTLRYKLIESCEPFQLLLAITNSTSVNVYDFCTKYYVTESTLKNKIHSINETLKSLNLRIRIKKQEIYLEGDEGTIRYYLTSIIWRVYNGLKFPFNNLIELKMNQLKNLIFNTFPNKITAGKKDLISCFFMVSIIRSLNHPIIKEQLPKYSYSASIRCPFYKNFIRDLKKMFVLNNLEIEFLILIFYTFPDFYMYTGLSTCILKVLYKQDINKYSSINKYIDFIKDKNPTWSIQSENGKKLYFATIASYISSDIFKEAYFNLQDLNLLKVSSQEFPNLIPSIVSAVKSFNSELSPSIIKSLSYRLAQAYLICFYPIDFEPNLDILLISDSPYYIERKTLYGIKSAVGFKYNINLTTDPYQFKNPDLIIATGVYLDIPDYIPTVYVFPQITKRDELMILKTCDEIYKKKYSK